VLIGLNGSKSIFTFFSLPSSVTMVPQYTTRPLVGTANQTGVNALSESTSDRSPDSPSHQFPCMLGKRNRQTTKLGGSSVFKVQRTNLYCKASTSAVQK